MDMVEMVELQLVTIQMIPGIAMCPRVPSQANIRFPLTMICHQRILRTWVIIVMEM